MTINGFAWDKKGLLFSAISTIGFFSLIGYNYLKPVSDTFFWLGIGGTAIFSALSVYCSIKAAHAPIVWSVPLAGWSGFFAGWGLTLAYCLYLRELTQSPFFLILLYAGIVGLIVLIWHFAYTGLLIGQLNKGLATEPVATSDQNWIAYKAHQATASPLPTKRPMTRSELIAYMATNHPGALEWWARQGIQIQRSKLAQIFNPFFCFKTKQAKIAAAHAHLTQIGIYQESYPEFEHSK